MIKLDGILKGLSIELRLRNISDEREIKIINKTVLCYHADGFDKNSQGVRIIFFDKMVKKWEDALFVSKNLQSIYIKCNKSTIILGKQRV